MGFVAAASALLLLVVGLLLRPLLKAEDNKPRYLSVLGTGAVLPALVVSLYLVIGNWQLGITSPESQSAVTQADADSGAADIEAMVGQLAERLRTQGGTAREWQMLGRSYMVMGRFQEATSAFAAARDQDASGDLELLGQYAESLALSVEGSLSGEAGQLFEELLLARPQDPRGLWYGGIAARQRGDKDLALARWRQLLQQGPPEELRQVLLSRIAEADGTAENASEPARSGESAAAGPVLRVAVSADTALIKDVGPMTPLFVLARSALPGPPLAVKRMRVADLPFEVTLSDEDAMMPGRDNNLSGAIEVVARIAVGGSPQAQSGDLFGQAELPANGRGDIITVIIDQRVQ